MKGGAGEPRPFPWREAMAAGFGLLRLSPREFWSMTPREFASALGAMATEGTQAPGRADLVALMRLFPDRRRGKDSDER